MVASIIWIFLPLHGDGYQFWSGIAGSFVTSGGVYALFLTHLKRHNCHVKGCWRFGHLHPEHGWPACRRHYDEDLDTPK